MPVVAPAHQPEVGEIGLVALLDEDVLRLDVAMHEPGGMRRVQRLGHGPQETDRPPGVELAAHDQLRERRAVDEAHRQEQTLRQLPRLVHADHVRMLERRLQAALAAEALQEGVVGRPSVRTTLNATRRFSRSWLAS